jgi:hypothetical protein
MGYARYVGRVGALAVTLGVGLAVANTPGIAYAEPVGSTPSASDSSAPSKDPSPKVKSPKVKHAQSSDESDSTDSPPSDPKPASDPADQATPKTDDDEDAEKVDAAAEPTIGEGSAEDDEETPPVADDASAKDDVPVEGSGGHRLRATPPADDSDEVKTSVTADVGQSNRSQSPTSNTHSIADDQVPDSSTDTVATFATTFSARTMAASLAPIAPQPRPTVVGLITNLVSAVLQPFMSPGTGVPMLPSLLLGVLAAVRNEIERALFRQTSSPTSQFTITQIDPTPNTLAVDPNPNVLVIGVDGTNLARILADPRNQNFFTLMDDSTTGASSIVGHTTISNPSWSTMLTGVWSERTGVINNVFTPWTYDKWPTVFNQLEEHNSGIETTTIADWDVINAISGAGSIPVDTNIYFSQIDGDTDWSQTDDAVGEATVDAIEDTPGGVPAFIFSYFVGVDENGHMHGGASPQYADAIVNVDENLGDIMTAVGDWETAHPTEGEWTILVVTDHGHQPQKGFGHGFQTPDETSTFVIANGPGFKEGFVNPKYAIVDTTPTVLTLFGAPVPTYVDGVSLTTLGGSDLDPVDLHQALQDQIATNHSPGLLTNVALSLRTIFATIPYYVWTLNNDGTIPVPLLGNVLYMVTNVPAQIIARLTGVTGARIFPLLPPGPPSWPGKEETITSDTSTLACDGGDPAAVSCDAASVA